MASPKYFTVETLDDTVVFSAVGSIGTLVEDQAREVYLVKRSVSGITPCRKPDACSGRSADAGSAQPLNIGCARNEAFHAKTAMPAG